VDSKLFKVDAQTIGLSIWALVPKFRVNPTRSPGGFASDLTSPLVTANWEAESGEKWTVPVGGGVGRIFRIGEQPMNASFQYFYNVEKLDPVGDWSIRMQLQFMFPRMG
jgi:hypothetical protein